MLERRCEQSKQLFTISFILFSIVVFFLEQQWIID
jgi:hypothetical protein